MGVLGRLKSEGRRVSEGVMEVLYEGDGRVVGL